MPFAARTGRSFRQQNIRVTNSQAGPLCRWLLHNGPVFLDQPVALKPDSSGFLHANGSQLTRTWALLACRNGVAQVAANDERPS